MNVTMPWNPSTDAAVNGVSSKLDKIRQTLGEQAEGLADVAAQYSSDAGSQASKIADEAGAAVADAAKDPIGSLSGMIQSLVDSISAFIASLTESGRQTATDLGHDAQAAAGELRKVRITTEPKKTGPDFMPGITLLGGFGAGIALMYFFDPEEGERRRTLLRDQLMKLTRQTGNTLQGRAAEARKSLEGVMASGQAATNEASESWDHVADSATSELADPSTTDTWGEQPEATDIERIEIR